MIGNAGFGLKPLGRGFARWPTFVILLTPWILAGCLATGIVTGLVVVPEERTAYLLTISQEQARSVCRVLGLDTARVEGRSFAEGRGNGLGTVFGCYLGDERGHLIICQDGDAVCLNHEKAHRSGLRHP